MDRLARRMDRWYGIRDTLAVVVVFVLTPLWLPFWLGRRIRDRIRTGEWSWWRG